MGNKRFDHAPKFVVKDDAVVIQQAVGSSAPLLDVKDHSGSSLMSITSAGAMTGANMTSPTLTGTPTAPTATAGTNTTQVATTAFVRTEISNLVASAPAALDTLDELAAALGDDANFATTVTNNLATKAPLESPTFTGTVTLPGTTSIGNVNSSELLYLDGVTSSIQTQLNSKAPTAGPTFTGNANFDLGTLYVDATNDRVGIGTDLPDIRAHIKAGPSGNSYNAYTTHLRVENSNSTGISLHTPSANNAVIAHATPLDGSSSSISFNGNRSISFATVNGTVRMTLDSSGVLNFPTASTTNINAAGTVKGNGAVVQFAYLSHGPYDLTSGSWIASVPITPKYSNSYIYVWVNYHTYKYNYNATVNNQYYLRNLSSGSNLRANPYLNYSASDYMFQGMVSGVESAGSTGTRTYAFYVEADSASRTYFYWLTMYALEIAQ